VVVCGEIVVICTMFFGGEKYATFSGLYFLPDGACAVSGHA
jgi:hypothetical protein